MSIVRVMDCPSMVRVLLQQINVLTYDNIYYTLSHTFLQPQTDILSSILSDREFDSSPFIRILVFQDVFYCKLALGHLLKIFKCDAKWVSLTGRRYIHACGENRGRGNMGVWFHILKKDFHQIFTFILVPLLQFLLTFFDLVI